MLPPAHASASEPPHRQEREDVDRALHGDVPPAFIENTTTTVERLLGGAELILQRESARLRVCAMSRAPRTSPPRSMDAQYKDGFEIRISLSGATGLSAPFGKASVILNRDGEAGNLNVVGTRVPPEGGLRKRADRLVADCTGSEAAGGTLKDGLPHPNTFGFDRHGGRHFRPTAACLDPGSQSPSPLQRFEDAMSRDSRRFADFV